MVVKRNRNAERTPRTGAKSMPRRKAQDGDPRTDGDEENKYFSRAVGKAFAILELLKIRNQSLALKDIEEAINLTKSSAFRLLQTLEQLTYIQQRADGRYVISDRYRPDSGAQVRETLLRSEMRVMRALQEEFQETVNIAVLFTNHIEVVRVMEAQNPVRMVNTVGRILSPHASSLGKVITAFQPEDVRRRLITSYGLVRFTPATITDEILLRTEFENIRKNGIAMEREESTLEGYCFGAPIFQVGSAAVGAISISLPKSRIPAAKLRAEMIDALRKAAEIISAELASVANPASRKVHPKG